ncbi:MAG: hypothetical protein ACO4AZ_01655 [Ilumatobacteraceae bacterium]
MKPTIFAIAVSIVVCALIGAAEMTAGPHIAASNETIAPYFEATVTTEVAAVTPETTAVVAPMVAEVQASAVRVATPTTTTTTTTAPLPMWNGVIPEVYGTGSGCTREQASIIARAMWAHGAVDSSVEWMLGIVSRESLCNSAAHNGNRNTGDDSWGLCQQNVLAGWFNEGKLLAGFDRYQFAVDFQLNAQSCALMWSVCGRGPWTKGDYGCSTPVELR